MRILFLCSSQEPGECGVGDYTRQLVKACEAHGVKCGIVSLSDPHSNSESNGVGAQKDGYLLWRLSNRMPWKEKAFHLNKIVDAYKPEWISLQFVPYGYHPRGLCGDLVKLSWILPKRTKRHIFFHELSLGLHQEDCFKNQIYGVLQRRIIRRLIRSWNPNLVHSHAAPYVSWLEKHHSNVKPLSLFGNIPVVDGNGPVRSQLEHWVKLRDENRSACLIGGYFGTFYSGAAEQEFVETLREFAETTGKKLICCLAGRQDEKARARWAKLEQSSNDNIQWIFLGELNEEEVSRYLQKLDFGIAATPWALAAKSGGVAAMREHGLPVLVSRNDWTPHVPVDVQQLDGLFPAWSGELDLQAVVGVKRPLFFEQKKRVTRQFLSDLDFSTV